MWYFIMLIILIFINGYLEIKLNKYEHDKIENKTESNSFAKELRDIAKSEQKKGDYCKKT